MRALIQVINIDTSMKKIFFILVSILISIQSFAQSSIIFYKNGEALVCDSQYYEADSLDASQMRVVYRYFFTTDTLTNTIEKDSTILDIGRRLSKYCHYLYFQTDSLLKCGAIKNFISNKSLPKCEPFQLSLYEMFFQDREKKIITCTGRVSTQNFKFVEEMPVFNWEIKDSTSIILGYNSVMATCSFKGRDYVAWFTPQIPVSSGPWKFSGLPGLILKVEDTRGFYRFEIAKVYPSYGSIDMQKYLYINSKNNKEYMKAKKLFFTDQALAEYTYLVNSDWFITLSKKRKIKVLGNDFIEIE